MTAEYKNLNDLLQLVPDEKKPIAKKLITELNFMGSTLVKLRKTVKEEGSIELFKNGKQEMLREHPAMRLYNSTVKQYSALFKQLTALLPDDAPTGRGGSAIYDFINGD